MRLKQKQFIPFMVTMGLISMVVIVISSFRFQNKQAEEFRENVAASDTLKTFSMRFINDTDSTSVSDYLGENTLLVFWASWSDKSNAMMQEIQNYTLQNDSLVVLAALVKDAEESLPERPAYPEFIYLDGTNLFNYLKVPGYPSYILFDEKGGVLNSHIGYEKGAGYDSLKVHLE